MKATPPAPTAPPPSLVPVRNEARLPVGLGFDATGASLAPAGYADARASVAGTQINGLAEQQYPLSAYPSPDLAFSAAFTDVGFSCISRLNDQLLARNALTCTFEFNDPDASNPSLPPDPFPPPGTATTTELPFLWPSLPGTDGAVHSSFNAPERALATGMQPAWTNFAMAGDPNGPGVTAWSPFSILGDRFHTFTPGAVGTNPGFAADHKRGFWEPLESARALLPRSAP